MPALVAFYVANAVLVGGGTVCAAGIASAITSAVVTIGLSGGPVYRRGRLGKTEQQTEGAGLYNTVHIQ
jgi:hypothetical protein